MRYSVVTTGVVKTDISEALEYYNAISLELAIRFGDDLLKAFNRLEYASHNYFNLGNGFRRANLRKFPHLVLYSIDEEGLTVKIWGVFHQHSNPDFIKRRLKAE